MKTGRETYVALLNLANAAGAQHYERLRLAHGLLRDEDWVFDPQGGGGDEGKALALLEAKCFADLCGAVTLPELLDVYEFVPEVEEWKKANWNFRRLLELTRERRRSKPTRRAPIGNHAAEVRQADLSFRPVPAKQFAQLPPTQANNAYEQLLQSYQTLRSENARLRKEIAKRQD